MHLINQFKTMSKKEKIMTLSIFAFMTFYIVSCMMGFPLAEGKATGGGKIHDVLESVIKVVKLVFQAVGIILSIYSVGQLVLAFKNEDADSKSRASTMLVVGVALIALPAIIDSLKLLDQLDTSLI